MELTSSVQVLEQVIPIMRNIPLVPKKLLALFVKIGATTIKFLTACELAEKILPGVEEGLTTSNMIKLRSSTSEVHRLNKTL